VVLNFLAVAVRETRETSHAHSHRQVLAFHKGR
jgi:hypothetical protein